MTKLPQICLFSIILFTINFNFVFAGTAGEGATVPAPIETPKSAGTVTLTDPLGLNGKDGSVEIIIGRVINAVLGFTGTIALIMFIYGGFTMMFSAGAAEKIKKGRDILIWASIGLAVIFSAYGLVQFVLNSIAGS